MFLKKNRYTLIPAVFALSGGVLFGISHAVTGYGIPVLLAFTLLAAAIWQQNLNRSLLLMVLWILPAYLISLSWTSVFGATPWIIMSFWHSLFVLPAAMVAWITLQKGRTAWAALAGAGTFTLGEWMVGQGPLAISMVQVSASMAENVPAIQWTSLVGATGLSLMVVFLGFWLGFSLRTRSRAGVVGVLVGIIILQGGGYALLASGPAEGKQIRVAVIQGVTRDGFETVKEDIEALRTYLRMTEQTIQREKPDIVIWPETSSPGYPYENEDLMNVYRTIFSRNGVPVIVGAVAGAVDNGDSIIRNVAIGFGPDGFIEGGYEKMRLVPFGEYVPAKRFVFSPERWRQGAKDYSPGRYWPPIPLADAKIGIMVCSEAKFAAIAVERVREGADILATMSNDSWFGKGIGTLQLARQTVMRAVESGRSIARASETGYSMMIDPKGRIIARSELYKETSLTADLPLSDQLTPYTRLHLWIPLLVLSITMTAVLISRR